MHEQLLPYLAHAARASRLAAGLAYVHIAVRVRKRNGRLGVSESTISRFELANAWPEDPDAMLEAYADATGTPAGELWDAAIAALRREDCDDSQAVLMSPR